MNKKVDKKCNFAYPVYTDIDPTIGKGEERKE